jgi:uncharacterized protein YuzE
MRMTYDPEADASYLKVAEAPIAETREVAPNVLLDLTADGDLAGIEIRDVARRPGANPTAMAFELLTRDRRELAAAAE